MKSIALIILMGACANVWGGEPWLQGVAYVSANNDGCKLSTGTIVWMSTATYTLSEFVSSGKFCEYRGGHRWFDWFDYSQQAFNVRVIMKPEFHGSSWPCPDGGDMCIVCHRCRQKMKVNKQVEELEP